jgi:hypothetical protein
MERKERVQIGRGLRARGSKKKCETGKKEARE